MAPRHIVLLIHGIRTHGSWAEMIADVLEQDQEIKVQPVKYGFFDTIKFLSPFFTRDRPVRRIVQEYRDTRKKYPNAKISAIAHSFGTYALTKSLREPDVEFHKVILCGSIVPEDFRVASHKAQISFDPILNDCGTHDIWPPFAKSVTWGYGATGTFGFGTVGIHDRFNKFSHSEYFSKDFVEKYWRPFITKGVIVPTAWEVERGTPPYWQSLLSIFPLKWLFVSLIALGSVFGWNAYQATKIASAQIVREMLVGHFVGTAAVDTYIVFSNSKNESVQFSNVSGYLVGPSAQRIDMYNYLAAKVDLQSSPASPISNFIVQPNETQVWQLSFGNDNSRQQPVLIQVFDKLSSQDVANSRWDPTREVLPPDLTRELTEIALEEFPFEVGKWVFNMTYIVDASLHEVSVGFNLSQSDIERIQSAIPFYASGLGILPNFLYLGPGGMRTSEIVAIEAVAE